MNPHSPTAVDPIPVGDPRSVTSTLSAVAERLRRALGQLAGEWQACAGGAAPILGNDDLPAMLADAVGGGKQVRPTMVHWGWLAVGGPARSHEQMIIAGAAFELLHAFAIVQDDVMDRSDTRRGRPTCHVLAAEAHRRSRGEAGADRFGDSIAILVGDLAHAEADHLIAELPRSSRRIWHRMVTELVLGQRADLTGTAAEDRMAALEVARLKTGSYTVQRPLEIGADLGGGSPAALASLDRFGHHLGRAYGLRDDVLGTFGDPRSTGKPVSDDLTSGKQTVLLILAEQRLSPAGRERLRRVASGPASADEVDLVRREMIETGVGEDVEMMISDEVTSALAALDRQHLDPIAIEGLSTAAEKLAWRTT